MIMGDSNQTLSQQEARYQTFRRRPWLGVGLLFIGIGIPGITAIVLAVAAPDIFFSSLTGRLGFAAIVAVAIWLSSTIVRRLRAVAIQREIINE